MVELFTGLDGDWLARASITVSELSGEDQLGALWGIRCRHYSAAATAALEYAADDLEALDAATGAGGTVEHTDLGTGWTPVLGTNMGGTAFLTHTGSYRVWAKAESDDGDDVQLRFVSDVGDLALPEENSAWTFPGDSEPYLADLGQIRLDEVPVGTHRWQGVVQAKGVAGGEQVAITDIYFQPLDEGAGKLVASSPVVDGLSDYVARDPFNQSAGALTGKTLAVGGAWAWPGAPGDTDDFAVEATGHTAQRTAVSDGAAINNGRYARAGTGTLTDVMVQADVKFSADHAGKLGVYARHTGAANEVNAFLTPPLASDQLGTLTLQYAAGAAAAKVVPVQVSAGVFYTIRLVIGGSAVRAWLYPQGSTPGDPAITTSLVKIGTSPAAGGYGIFDHAPGATACTRNFKNFSVAVPTRDAVLFADQTTELRTDGTFRETADGAGWGPTAPPVGDLPRLPPSGMEGRPVELFLLTSAGDFDQLPDSGVPDVSIAVAYRPSWLFVPAS